MKRIFLFVVTNLAQCWPCSLLKAIFAIERVFQPSRLQPEERMGSLVVFAAVLQLRQRPDLPGPAQNGRPSRTGSGGAGLSGSPNPGWKSSSCLRSAAWPGRFILNVTRSRHFRGCRDDKPPPLVPRAMPRLVAVSFGLLRSVLRVWRSKRSG